MPCTPVNMTCVHWPCSRVLYTNTAHVYEWLIDALYTGEHDLCSRAVFMGALYKHGPCLRVVNRCLVHRWTWPVFTGRVHGCSIQTRPTFMGRVHGLWSQIVSTEPNTATHRKHFTCNWQKSDPPANGKQPSTPISKFDLKMPIHAL